MSTDKRIAAPFSKEMRDYLRDLSNTVSKQRDTEIGSGKLVVELVEKLVAEHPDVVVEILQLDTTQLKAIKGGQTLKKKSADPHQQGGKRDAA